MQKLGRAEFCLPERSQLQPSTGHNVAKLAAFAIEHLAGFERALGDCPRIAAEARQLPVGWPRSATLSTEIDSSNPIR